MTLFHYDTNLFHYKTELSIHFFLKQTRNKIKIIRKYRTVGHEPDLVNLKETTLKIKRQNSKQSATTDNPTHPRMDAKPNCKKT